MKKMIKDLLIIACLIVIGYEVFTIFHSNKQLIKANALYEDIKENALVTTDTKVENSYSFNYPKIDVNFKMLENTNPDFVAWIYIPCLDISYPVVKEQYINEYEHLTFKKEKNVAGCIFTDVLSSSEFTGYHDIIFGHNMRDGSMFGKLKYILEDNSIIDNNPYVYIYTKDCVHKCKVFAYYLTKIGSDSYSVVENTDDYDTFLSYIYENNLCRSQEEIDFNNHPSILTLSTCNGKSGSGKRFVIHTYREDTCKRK